MKKITASVLFFLFISLNFLSAEQKTYINKEKGYNVIAEVNFVGANIPNDKIEEYRATLADWNADTGLSTKKVQKISKEVSWGLKKALADVKAKNGQTYVIRITPVPEDSKPVFYFITALITVKNNKYEFWDVYETYVSFENQAETDSHEDGVYSSPDLGYKGRASATLAGKNLTKESIENVKNQMLDISKKNGRTSVEMQNLTKEENWLLNQALIRHNLSKGETYIVSIIPEPKNYQAEIYTLTVILTITDVDNKMGIYSYNFKAYKQM